eukprot:3803574-Alexandrium_andersonii.AAC.1
MHIMVWLHLPFCTLRNMDIVVPHGHRHRHRHRHRHCQSIAPVRRKPGTVHRAGRLTGPRRNTEGSGAKEANGIQPARKPLPHATAHVGVPVRMGQRPISGNAAPVSTCS